MYEVGKLKNKVILNQFVRRKTIFKGGSRKKNTFLILNFSNVILSLTFAIDRIYIKWVNNMNFIQLKWRYLKINCC